MTTQEDIKAKIEAIRNELERIEMHTEGDPDYDTISDLTDIIESYLEDIREFIEEALDE